MKFRKRVKELFYSDITALELFLATMGLVWGLFVALPFTNVAVNSDSPIRKHEVALGLWMAGINFFKLFYIYKGGGTSWRRWLVRSFNNLTWFSIFMFFLYSNPQSSGIPVYFLLALVTTLVTIRSGLEERI
jgi:hypothetical protein